LRIPFDVPAPSAIKKFATGKGNANKEKMEEAFVAETGFDMRGAMKQTQSSFSPSGDLIDAYYMAKWAFHNTSHCGRESIACRRLPTRCWSASTVKRSIPSTTTSSSGCASANTRSKMAILFTVVFPIFFVILAATMIVISDSPLGRGLFCVVLALNIFTLSRSVPLPGTEATVVNIKEMISECQADLPRNQNCVIDIGVRPDDVNVDKE
jgi:hypothetical protein